MTFGKATAFGMCLIAAIGFGIWVSPHVMPDRATTTTTNDAIEGAAPSPATRSVPTAETATVVSAREALPPASLDDPLVRARLEALLNRGADVTVAGDGFDDVAQFAAVAHAARNTGVPFMLLKHRVLEEHLSLADAIARSQPTLNAVLEAERASAEAWSDLARIAG